MTYRRATYPAATRIGQLLLLLAANPNGLPKCSVAASLGVSDRTLYRYQRALVAICGEEIEWKTSRLKLRDDWERRTRLHARVSA